MGAEPVTTVERTGRKSAVAPELYLTGLAEKAGISLGYLSQIINRSKIPSVKVSRKLAKVLGVTVDEVLRIIETQEWPETG